MKRDERAIREGRKARKGVTLARNGKEINGEQRGKASRGRRKERAGRKVFDPPAYSFSAALLIKSFHLLSGSWVTVTISCHQSLLLRLHIFPQAVETALFPFPKNGDCAHSEKSLTSCIDSTLIILGCIYCFFFLEW